VFPIIQLAMTRIQEHTSFVDYADCLRVFAILAVIALHSSASGIVQYGQLGEFNWWAANAVDSMCRWAVPVFIMLSGALLLTPSRRDKLWNFYLKRLRRVGIPLVIWAACYFYWTARYYGEAVDKEFIVDALKSGLTYNHLYFLFIVLGLYAVTPPLRKIVGGFPVWALWLLALFFMAMPVFGILYHVVSMNAFTMFLPYLGYFLIGHLIRSVAFWKHTLAVSLACYGSSSLAITLATGMLVGQLGIEDPQALRYYNHFHWLVVIQSISIFFVLRCLFYAVDAPCWNKILRRLAPLTFGIYLIHVIFLDIARNYTSFLYENITILGIFTELVMVYAISAFASYVLLKTPGVRWVIGS